MKMILIVHLERKSIMRERRMDVTAGDIISSDNILATLREDLENKNNKRVKKEGYFESL
ncbi:15913_t:CDS:2 [Rhizophagus irregularis]|nr:15913_t:CDS:2 [Rhizophagus irregularis]